MELCPSTINFSVLRGEQEDRGTRDQIVTSLADFREKKTRIRRGKSKSQLNLFECVNCDCGCRLELINMRATIVNSLASIEQELVQIRKKIF
jgi:hypothetical protein